MKNICNSYEEHMENENININANGIDIKDNRKRGCKGKKEEEKIHFAEFVSMTNAEYEKLISTYGKDFADQCIYTLDNYKGSKRQDIQKRLQSHSKLGCRKSKTNKNNKAEWNG